MGKQSRKACAYRQREEALENWRAFIRQIEGWEEYKIIDQAVQQVVTADDAVQRIKDLTMAALAVHGPSARDGIGLVDYHVSLAVIELAQRIEPGRHGRLVEFLLKLQAQTATDPATDEPLKVDGRVLWTDMPSFGYTEVEAYDECGGEHKDPCDPAFNLEQRDRWVKLNAFLAQLTQAAYVRYGSPGETAQFHILDKSLRATWTLNTALVNLEHSDETLAGTAAMEAACQWFIYGADILWANVVHGRAFPDFNGLEKEFFNAFERERWDLWVRSLRKAEAACADKRMKKLIQDALAHANRAVGGT